MTSKISGSKCHLETKTKAKDRCDFPQKVGLELKMEFFKGCSAGICRWTFVTVPGRAVIILCLMWWCFVPKESHPRTAQAFSWSLYKEILEKSWDSSTADPNLSSDLVLWLSFRRVWNYWGLLYQSREEILYFLDPRELSKPLGHASLASGRKVEAISWWVTRENPQHTRSKKQI